MVFYFMNAATGGVEIMIDSHTAAGGTAVQVTGGLFNVQLGSGNVIDGSGAGTYNSLANVFKDYGAVYLKIVVNGEELSSRPRVVSAAYALNASYLSGLNSAAFLNVTGEPQVKSGTLTVDASSATNSYGVMAYATYAAGYFASSGYSGRANLGFFDEGVHATGNSAGGFFGDSNGTGQAYLGYGNIGIDARGSDAGGYFADSDLTSHAYLGWDNVGIEAVGNTSGGHFQSSSGNGYAFTGHGTLGIMAGGTEAGARIESMTGTGRSWVGYGNLGIESEGSTAGGHFLDTNGTGEAHVGYGDYGISAQGSFAGGYFSSPDGNANAIAGYVDEGIYGRGTSAGGHFRCTAASGYAFAGAGDWGLEGFGNTGGGQFNDLNSSGWAYIGYGDYGAYGSGNTAGGFFKDGNGTGYGYVGISDDGLQGYGNGSGGYFYDLNEYGNAHVGYGTRGIWARGSFAGGTFSSLDNVTNWADVAKPNYKIVGTGAVSFVQNHPYDTSRSIVYAAPEGDEVAVYTRGTARLVKGEARVRLGETFRWVANPDIGLTAHLTPHGDCRGLYVQSLTTEELVVRELGGGASEVTFDFLVYGLRLGFEELAIMQAKDRDALPPTADALAKPYEGHEELRAANALERYRAMRAATGEGGEADMSRSRALLAALEAQRAEAVARGIAEGPPQTTPPELPPVAAPTIHEQRPDPEPAGASSGATAQGRPGTADARAAGAAASGRGSSSSGEGVPPATIAADSTWFAVSEPVEPGDLLALDPDRPGQLRRAASVADPSVVGIAAAAPTILDGASRVPVAGAGFTTVKADALGGAIVPGDLLTASATPGHAMKASIPAPAGALVGKALERLDAGTGLIRILVLSR